MQMGSPSELSLDYKPNGNSTALVPLGEQPDQTQKLEEFLTRLEEERLKIDAFKRELPLCMQLLNNAMEAYRQQLETYNTNQGPSPVLEEFIPLKHTEAFERSPPTTVSPEKASWMTSAQLWSQASDGAKQLTAPLKDTTADRAFDVSPKLALDGKQRNGGAFLPFSKERSKGASSTLRVLPDLALASSEKEFEEEEKKCPEAEKGAIVSRRENCSKSGGGGAAAAEQGKGAAVANQTTEGQAAAPETQTHRKARRCWSPDLHRRFVNALQMLGGSQIATPKQIRELMKVDGLTNDEVKSHLQKYRLHTRRPIPAPPAAASSAAPQLVVLGGIWVPPEYATSGHTIYGAHPTPAHYCASPVPQDFYPHHYHHQPPHHHRGTATAASAAAYKGQHESPESEVRGIGERSESIEEEEEEEVQEEEGRSESNSWKGGEEKVMVSAREDGEESNGSDVTLKF